MTSAEATSVFPFLCQTSPRLKSRNPLFPDDKETDSIDGYQTFGRRWNASLFEANKITGRFFQWLVNVNFLTPLTAEELIERKAVLLKNLGRNKSLSLFWRLQINDKNTSLVHFHFAVLNGFTDDLAVLDKVVRKACSGFADDVRIFTDSINDDSNYIPYINKTRKKHRNKIVLFSKSLPRFSKIGVLHYPWPGNWSHLPSLSPKNKGGIRERFLKSRKRQARQEWDRLQYTDISPFYRDYLCQSSGKRVHEVRQMLVENIPHWEEECEKWQQTTEAKEYLDTLRERLAQADKEIKESHRRRPQSHEPDIQISPATKATPDSLSNHHRTLHGPPSSDLTSPPLKASARVTMASDRPCRRVAVQSIPKPFRCEGGRSGIQDFWMGKHDIRLPFPRSP
jgi:hypothetical protein